MKVLIADDDPVTSRMLEGVLGNAGYDVVVAHDGIEACAQLARPDAAKLMILDWMMPGLSGVDVTRSVRSTQQSNYRYIILLTAKSDKAAKLEGLAAGADDFLVKPVDLEELYARIRTGERVLELEDRLVTALDRAEFRADHDGLTELFNHNAILQILNGETARSMREASCVGVLLIDIDHFKLVNDTHGHAVGDAVLKKTADIVRQTVREYDSVGRYGGEELMVVVPRCTLRDALHLAERLRKSVAREPIRTPLAQVPLTISIGVAVGRKQSAEALLRAADDALYRAKNDGRNRVENGGRVDEALSQSSTVEHNPLSAATSLQ
jgi:two-component system, cell cycle response regulator